MRDDLLLIGRVVAPFGVHGELKLKAFTDHPEHVARRVRSLYLLLAGKLSEQRLTGLYEHKPGLLILSLAGISDREAAATLRGAEVYIAETDAAPLAEGEYFIHQLIGISAFTSDGAPLGTVREVLTSGAGEVLVIARPDQPDALVPMVQSFISEFDLAAGRVVINPIEGLL